MLKAGLGRNEAENAIFGSAQRPLRISPYIFEVRDFHYRPGIWWRTAGKNGQYLAIASKIAHF